MKYRMIRGELTVNPVDASQWCMDCRPGPPRTCAIGQRRARYRPAAMLPAVPGDPIRKPDNYLTDPPQ